MAPDPLFIETISVLLEEWLSKTADIHTHLTTLNAERPNLYRLIEFGLGTTQTCEEAARLTVQTFKLAEIYGYWAEWIPLLEQALGNFSPEPDRLKFEILNRLGQLRQFNEQYHEALEVHQQALQVAEQLQDASAIAQARFSLCLDTWRLRRHSEAEEHGQMALSAFSDLQDEEQTAVTLNMLAFTAMGRGEYVLAEQRLEQAVILSYQAQPANETARILSNLADLLRWQGKMEAAIARCQESLQLLEKTAYDLLRAKTSAILGAAYVDSGRFEEAEATLKQTYMWVQNKTADIPFLASLTNNLGNLFLVQGRYSEAEIYLQEAIYLFQQTNNKIDLALAHGNLAETLLKKAEKKRARQLFQKAINLLDEFPEDAWAQQLKQEYGDFLKEMGTDKDET